MNLHDYLARSAEARGPAIAVEEADAKITYRGLADLAALLRRHLIWLGVKPGDRVGICLQKSIDAIAAIFGVLEAGAAYVPLDPAAPSRRNAFILNDCSVKVLLVERAFEAPLQAELALLGCAPECVVLDEVGGGSGLQGAIRANQGAADVRWTPGLRVAASSLAYILYTSGSTGLPKGVMLSHQNGVSFVEWCLRTFHATASDRLSSHAPFIFDLSIHDVFVSIASGASLVLIPEALAKDAPQLAHIIAERRISIWYSVPYILNLMAQFGKLASKDYSALRAVLFAGEAFPTAQLQALHAEWPGARYYNLYGPTETNVCTHYEVPSPLPHACSQPLPLGRLCDHLRSVVVKDDGQEAPAGVEGELCVSGSNVLIGYWNRAEQTAEAFLPRPGRYYRTGDIVVSGEDGMLRFLGRRDRMVKKRGFRVELGEIEACLHAHPRVREVAVTTCADEANGIVITANVSLWDSGRMSVIELRKYCTGHLPIYMIPDRFNFCNALPRTGTDKVDYQRLIGEA